MSRTTEKVIGGLLGLLWAIVVLYITGASMDKSKLWDKVNAQAEKQAMTDARYEEIMRSLARIELKVEAKGAVK